MGIRNWFKNIRAALTPMSLEELFQYVIAAGGTTASGATVTPDRAMRVVAVYAAVRVLAETLAQAPLILYRRLPDVDGRPGGKERATDHWLYPLLHDAPNQFQTSFEWREMMQGHLALRGNAYSLKVSVRDEIRELLPLHPDRVTVAQETDWTVRYHVALPDGQRVEVPAAEILHLKGLSSNGYAGVSPIQLAREAIGLAIETERHGAQLFANGARPSGVLSTEKNLKPEQMKQIRESWNEGTGGDNRLSVHVLDGGFKWELIGIPPEDAQFLETRKFQRTEIAGMFRVPPHMIGDLERATFTNIEHQSLDFVKYTMGPWFGRWEDAISMQLIPARDRGELFAEFLVDGLLRGDSKARSAFYSMALRDGWLNRNEVRAMENRNPIEGGDEYNQAINIYGPSPAEDRREQTPDPD